MHVITRRAAALSLLWVAHIAAAQAPAELELSARLHADVSRHFGDDPPAAAADGTDVRRARFGLSGRFDERIRFTGEVELTDRDAPIRDFWLRYDHGEHIGVTVGHQKQPYSLSLEMSSNDIPFVERSIDNALNAAFLDRAVGVRVDATRGRWFAAAGLYGEALDGGQEGWGTSARFVLAPVIADERVVHVGLRAAYREPDADADPVRLRSQTTDDSELYISDTGLILGTKRVVLLGPEAAFVRGPFSLLGEYTLARLDTDVGEIELAGWHLGAAWTLGGVSRASAYALDSGEFKGIEPAGGVRRSRGGTWELAGRYAKLDLNDGPLTGGEETRFTLSANWYATRHVRVMLDWTHIFGTDESNGVRAAADDMDFVTFRAQYAF